MEAKYYNNGTLPPAWYRDINVMARAKANEENDRMVREQIRRRDEKKFRSWWFVTKIRIHLFLYQLGIR